MKFTKETFFGLTNDDLEFIKAGKAADINLCENIEEYLQFKKIEEKTASFIKYFSTVGIGHGIKNKDDLQDFCQVCYSNYLGKIAHKVNWSLEMKEILSFITKSCVRHYLRSEEYKVVKEKPYRLSLDNEVKDIEPKNFETLTYVNVPQSYNIPSPSVQYEIDKVNNFTFGYLAEKCPTLFIKTAENITHEEIGRKIGCTHQNVSWRLQKETPIARQEAERRELDFSFVK